MKKTLVFASLGGLLFAGVASGAYQGLYSEIYTNDNFTQPAGTVTYRLYATFDNDLDQIYGMGGTADQPWTLTTNTAYFQEDSFGGNWAHMGNLDVPFDYLSLHFDSYWAIGSDSDPGGFNDTTFDLVWTDTMFSVTDGGVYRLPEDPYTFPVDGKVLLGQFTVDLMTAAEGEELWGAVKLAGTSDGEPLSVYEDILIPIPAPGALALLGLAGLVGRRRR